MPRIASAAASSLLLCGLAQAANHSAGASYAATTIPLHVFAPYFEAYTSDNPATLSAESGARYLTLAFIETPAKGSCTIDWNGDSATPVSPSVYGADIANIRASGGDVIPSFGGYTADHTGAEIADSCTSVSKIAAAYEKVVTTYNVTRLDLDVEDNSLTDLPGIDRRNHAITQTQAIASRAGR